MNILTIDLEDWFHILAHDETASPRQWEKFESRVERNTDWILEQLAVRRLRGTFFCLGWIAKRHPGLISKMIREGHEVGCHSMNHQLVYEQGHEAFKEDLRNCLHLLEDLTGTQVHAYRAPGFSVTSGTKWIFETLLENGISVDSSVFPADRNHGGYKDFPSSRPCLIKVNGKTLKEFPMSMATFLGKNIVFSGGGYFRLIPYPVIKRLMKKSDYVMTYFHPRDFDPDQPVISTLPLRRKWMSYTGLSGAKKKFEMLLNDFQFVNISQAAAQIPWSKVPIVSLD